MNQRKKDILVKKKKIAWSKPQEHESSLRQMNRYKWRRVSKARVREADQAQLDIEALFWSPCEASITLQTEEYQ
jgi:hypothetical protein